MESKMDCLIKNCHLISPELELKDAAIAVKDGRIVKVFQSGEELPEAEFVYDAEGNMAMPGFIDIHFHGAGGFDVCDGTIESIENIARIKLTEGCTTICPTTLTLPEEVLTKSMEAVAEYKKDEKYSKVAGVHLEGPYVNVKAAGAQNPDYVRLPDIEEVKRLNAISNVSIVSYAVEQEGAVEFTRELRELDIIPSCGHSKATYADFTAAKEAGLMHLTHFCNQMTPVHHREIGLVGAGLIDEDIVIEMISDKIHLCPDMINLVFKAKQGKGIALITDALAASGLEDGEYDLGGLGIRVADGAARLTSNNALAGSTLKYYNALKNVYEVTGLPLTTLVKSTSLNQAQNLGIADLGKLEAGYIADIVILDKDFVPVDVFVSGEVSNA